MTRAQVIAKLRAVAARMAARGHRVVFVPGWENRGRSGFNPRAGMNHDTADPRPLPWSTLLNILMNGHGALAGNAICNTAIPRDAHAVYVIAAGLAWHAGNSVWRGKSGNSAFFGCEQQAAVTQTVTAAQVNLGLEWDAEVCIEFGIDPDDFCEHREAAIPAGRKQDRRGVSGPDYRRRLRARVAQLRAGVTVPAPSTPSTSTALATMEDNMLQMLWDVQKRHAYLLDLTNGFPGRRYLVHGWEAVKFMCRVTRQKFTSPEQFRRDYGMLTVELDTLGPGVYSGPVVDRFKIVWGGGKK